MDGLKKLGQKTVLDVGCNKGIFSKLFARIGMHVVSIDNAPNCINNLYESARKMGLTITPLCINITNTERKKYDSDISRHNEEMDFHKFRDGDWIERLSCDVTFVSSVSHHLFKAGFDFCKQAKLWKMLRSKYLLIEFISANDLAIRTWNMRYTKQTFLDSMTQEWKLIEEMSINTNTRIWFLFERLP